jgi:hypothetical protein
MLFNELLTGNDVFYVMCCCIDTISWLSIDSLHLRRAYNRTRAVDRQDRRYDRLVRKQSARLSTTEDMRWTCVWFVVVSTTYSQTSRHRIVLNRFQHHTIVQQVQHLFYGRCLPKNVFRRWFHGCIAPNQCRPHWMASLFVLIDAR